MSTNSDTRTPLPPQVRKLGWISFWADICSEMTYTITPLFLVGVLRAPAAILGVVEGIAEAVVAILKGWAGWQSDRIGKRTPFIRWGYTLSAVAKPTLALAVNWPTVLAARVLDRTGKGLRTAARDALIADAVPANERGRAFGWHRSLDTWGAVVGIALAVLLVSYWPDRFREIFLLAFIPGALSIWLSFKVIESSSTSPITKGWGLNWRAVGPRFRKMVFVLGLFALANTSDAFLIQLARESGFSIRDTILLYALHNITFALSAYPAGALSDRFGRVGLMAISWVGFSVVYLGFGLADPTWYAALFALYGLHVGVARGVGAALVADLAPVEARGSAIGWIGMVQGLATIASNIMMGVIWDSRGPQFAFIVCAAVGVVATIALVATRHEVAP